MPMAAARPCATCGTLRCTAHVRQAWQEKPSTTPRTVTGRHLQAARLALYLQQGGQCAKCKQPVLYGPKTFIRDHTKPLAEGGLDVSSNTSGLCASCSDQKTQREAMRGRQRGATH